MKAQLTWDGRCVVKGKREEGICPVLCDNRTDSTQNV